jgi:ATPase subunit of ABC transporter with duplicated ATPase domains
MAKLGKNEAKRLAAAARAELDEEVDEETRQRQLRRGMGLVATDDAANSKYEERMAAQKQSKEEKEAAKAAAKERLAAKKAERAEAKEAEAEMRAKIEANRRAIAAAALGEATADGSGGGDGQEPSYSSNYDESGGGGGEQPVDVTDEADAPKAAAAKGGKAKAKGGSSKAGAKKGKDAGNSAAAAKKDAVSEYHQGVLKATDDMPFFQKSGPAAAIRKNMAKDVKIGGIRMCAGKQELLDSAVLALNYGVKYGLVGRNGVGKTTLLRHLAEGLIPLPKFLNVVHVEQEITGDERSALRTIVEADQEREWLLKVEEMLLDGDEDTEKALGIGLNEVYERLEDIDSDHAESRAAQLLAGLGFDRDMQAKPTREYSGGWRMRIALAQALFTKPDLLLLDEPTNHLDVHALTWLEFFLAGWERTVLIVSHDRGFLNKVTTATMFIHGKRLRYYGGNYDTFLKVRAEHWAMNTARQKQNERRVSHLKSFIARFGHGAKNLAKQAQSRMKMLQKIQDEPCEVDFDDPYLKLDFPSASTLPPPCISVTNVAFAYPLADGTVPDKPLYKDLNFGLDCDSRVAIVGPNGAGKSTFLKLLTGEIQPTDGHVSRHAKLIVAKFTQHHIDTMDMEKNSVNHMKDLTKEGVSTEEARKYLGRFGLSGDLALNPIGVLSGGQKSRLAFAELAWRTPHILLLDEPTNHLDLETIEALAMAINAFDGGVVFVTHDERLIELCSDELWVVNKGVGGQPGSVTVWHSSYEAYKGKLQAEFVEAGLVTNGTVKGVRD